MTVVQELPGQQEHGEGGPQVGCRHVDPHVHREGLDEGEQVGRVGLGLLVEDADTLRGRCGQLWGGAGGTAPRGGT